MASSAQELPVSALLKGDAEDAGPVRQSKEEWRKAKELEEARKAGTAPAEVDEEGKDINPHIPLYISKVPWYFGDQRPTLKHQRVADEKVKPVAAIDQFYKRGIKTGSVATRYRKGACENCGALTHKRKDCLERPRKVLAKYSGEKIAPDEWIPQDLPLSFDGKRDHWSSYDTRQHQNVIEEYNKVEEAKVQLKAKKLHEDLMNAGTLEEKEKIKALLRQESGLPPELDDEDKYAEDANMPGTKFEIKERITVRNLRIREDTAKYLRNLDPNSAFYDPKTRTMRENPYKTLGKKPDEVEYAGDNFVRASGHALDHAKNQLFAWEANEKGVDVHLQAEPTKLQMLTREYGSKKEELKSEVKSGILEKYGGQEHLDVPPKQLLMAQSEEYVEYSRSGSVVKGQERAPVKSVYEEDVLINNHTSVWGSFWNGGNWGYKCCNGMVQQSYCTGKAGREAVLESNSGPLAVLDETPAAMAAAAVEENTMKNGTRPKRKENRKQEKKRSKVRSESSDDSSDSDSSSSDSSSNSSSSSSSLSSSSSSSDSSSDEETESGKINKKKLRKAMRAEEEHRRKEDELLSRDERKRPYNSMVEVKAPTEEEMEAFRMKRMRADDPMAQFLK